MKETENDNLKDFVDYQSLDNSTFLNVNSDAPFFG